MTDHSVIKYGNMAPRTDKQIEELKNKRISEILEAALQIFAERGVKNATMSQIAQKAQISKGNIYNYFPSKQDLLKEVINTGFEPFIEYFREEQEKQITGEDLKQYVRYTFKLIVDNFRHWKLYFSLLLQPEASIIVETELSKSVQPFMENLLTYFVSKGSQNPYAEMRSFIAVLDGMGMHYLIDPENFPLEESIEIIINKFIR